MQQNNKNNLYVFLTNTISRISGGPIYVDNKRKYLEGKGWVVKVFDGDDLWGEDIMVDGLRKYKKNRLFELQYPPSWYCALQRNRVINKIVLMLPKHSFCVIESNQITMAEWGELIAAHINAKHIFFNINENTRVLDKQHYDFLCYKLQHNELFTISASAIETLFSKYCFIQDSEKHFWHASVDTDIVDYPFAAIDNIPRADHSIGYFGRYKSFLPYVFEQIASFATFHREKTVNLLLLGVDEISASEASLLRKANVNTIILGRKSPIPASFFNNTDVVIATAGCAIISYRYGAKVISMNVEDKLPLGFLGYTTDAISYANHFITDKRSLFEMLESFYNKMEDFNHEIPNHYSVSHAEDDYKYQLSDLSIHSEYYDTAKINAVNTKSQKIKSCIVKAGLARFLFRATQMQNKSCH